MNAKKRRAQPLAGLAEAQPGEVAPPLLQYARMVASRAKPFRTRPEKGYARGIDVYTAAGISRVISTAAVQFYRAHRRFPNLIAPERYSDKIFWSKFFRQLKVPESGNKLLTASFIPDDAKDLVQCAPIVWHSRRPIVPRGNEVEPGIYYLKANFGADRYRRLIYPISDAEAEALDVEFAAHLANPYNWWRGEWWYNVFPRELLLERSIGSSEYPMSWNFLVIAGEVELIVAYRKLGNGAFEKTYLSPAFDPMPDRGEAPPAALELPSEKARSKMTAAARAIGSPLRFVRVDFLLDDDDQPYLGEVSFTPGNATARHTDELDLRLGRAWNLSSEIF